MRTRSLLATVALATLVGLAFIARAAIFYRGVDPVAHGLVLLIGLGLLLGATELVMRARRVNALADALAALPESPGREAIQKTPAPLRAILEARLVGTPAGLGSPVFTPYLIGLLVMIGLLGTFMGLFETLGGAREALTSSGDVLALREGLAAPMKGLSRAFGTSAAGVSASAMLGLAAVFVRRAEGRFATALTRLFSGPLFSLTLAGRQLAALEAMAEHKDALPKAAKAIEKASARIEALEKKLAEGQRETSERAAKAFEKAAKEVRADVSSGVSRAAEAVAPLLDQAVAKAGEVAGLELGRWSAQLAADAEARRTDERAHRAELLRLSEEALEKTAKLERERIRELTSQLDSVVLSVDASLSKLTEREEASAKALHDRFAETTARLHTRLDAAAEALQSGLVGAAKSLEGRFESAGASVETRLVSLVENQEKAAERADVRDRERLALLEARLVSLAATQEKAAERADVRDVERLALVEARLASLVENQEKAAERADVRDGERLALVEARLVSLVENQEKAAERADVRDRERLATVAAQLSSVLAGYESAHEHAEARDVERLAVVETRLGEMVAALETASQRIDAREADRLAKLDMAMREASASLEKAATQMGERDLERLVMLEEHLDARAENERLRGERSDAIDRERLSTLADAAGRIEAQAAAFSEAIGQYAEHAREADIARAKSAEGLLGGIDEKLEAHLAYLGERLATPLAEAAKATQAGPLAVEKLVLAERDRIVARERSDADRDARLEALVSSIDKVSASLAQRADDQLERVAMLDEKLEKDREATMSLLAEKIGAHAEEVSEQLRETADMVKDAVGLVHAGGAEMSAVAEMFTSAVDRYCGASEKWLDSVSTIEAAIEKKSGRDEAADLLGAYLDQTREVFDHSLAFQRELFTELRALRTRGAD